MAQRGFEYERNIVNYLKPLGIVPQSFNPAGARHDQPDVLVQYDGKEAGVEIKISEASFGSLVLKYYLEERHNGKNPWKWGETEGSEEKQFIESTGNSLRVLENLHRQWKRVPFLIEDRQTLFTGKTGKFPGLRQRLATDQRNFRDKYFSVPNNTISRYYNLKNTYYINLGNKGFFLLGNSDPLGLNNVLRSKNMPLIPNWDNSHSGTLRCRVQSKTVGTSEARELMTGNKLGAQGYQFTAEFKVTGVSQSPYNIAPIRGNTVSIDSSASTAEVLFSM